MTIEVGRLEPEDWLGTVVHVVIDRPLDSIHPKWGFRYETNYGYVPGLIAPDGEELDAYVVGTDEPIEECEGEVVAVVKRYDDVEDKLVVSLGGTWDAGTIATAIAFQEAAFDSEIFVSPPAAG